MKEFCAQTGGRYTYVDDIANLQDLALAFASIFDDCDNFIISGCRVSGASISEGYVYINGKIRRFSGASGITTWPQYIYESNKTETVAYASGADKVGRNVYGCALSKDVPTFLDPLTNAAPMFIAISNAGGMTIKDAFFGKYALLLESAAGQQIVKDIVTFTKNISVRNTLTVNGRILMQSGNAKCEISHVAGGVAIQSTTSVGKVYTLKIDDTEGFRFFVDNTLIFSMSDSRIGTDLSITMRECIAGSIGIHASEIYNKGTASDTGSISINMIGYAGGGSYYRNTVIGDGKGAAILSITGSTKNVRLNGLLDINSPDKISVKLKKGKIIEWRNDGETQIAHIGYFADSNLSIVNIIAGINITGAGYVNIAPVIKENGVSLSDKYATLSSYLSDMATTENNKKKIRNNIDAEQKGVCEPKWGDTMWCPVTGMAGLYVRQKGDIVCLQGWVNIGDEDSVVFYLPQEIDTSSRDIRGSITLRVNNGIGMFAYMIENNSRQCTITPLNGAKNCKIDISLTYML